MHELLFETIAKYKENYYLLTCILKHKSKTIKRKDASGYLYRLKQKQTTNTLFCDAP
jgi:hypothetical protein